MKRGRYDREKRGIPFTALFAAAGGHPRENREWRISSGDVYSSESALSKIYGIHRLSVRSAISALEYEGLLRSVQGKGVFVIGGKDERDLETIGGFKQTMQMLGRTPSTK